MSRKSWIGLIAAAALAVVLFWHHRGRSGPGPSEVPTPPVAPEPPRPPAPPPQAHPPTGPKSAARPILPKGGPAHPERKPPAPVVTKVPPPAQTAAPKAAPPPATKAAAIAALPQAPAASKLPPAPPAPLPPPEAPKGPGAPSVELHRELIPREISIVRCYYEKEIVAPGTSLGMDVDGSGFTTDFAKTIALEPGAKDVRVKNLRLVTPNQIHGELEVGDGAATAFVYPRVLIKGLPVFVAPSPFAVVRPGEVLDIRIVEVSEDGRSARLRVLTNIDQNMFNQFWMEPTKKGPTLSPLQAVFPFAVEGILHVAEAGKGNYGLTVSIFSREVFRKEGIQIVPPNLGVSGLATHVLAVDPYHRPGDLLQLDLIGTGFSPDDLQWLRGHIEGLPAAKALFDYGSPRNIRVVFPIPAGAREGAYGVTITGLDEKILVDEEKAFTIVPPRWIRGLNVDPPVGSGERSTLKIVGRDFTPEFARSVQVAADEPGIQISNPRFVDPLTLAADIGVQPSVAAGDYVLHVTVQGKPVNPQLGSVIKVLTP